MISDLKQVLASKYEALASDDIGQLVKLFIRGGKKHIASMLRTGKASLSSLIMNEDYYLSNVDIILLSQHYKVPVVIFSSTTIPENKQTTLIAYNDGHANYYFIKSPGIQIDSPMKYRLVVAPSGAKIRVDQLGGELKTQMIAVKGYQDINQLINSGKKEGKPKVSRLKIVEKLENEDSKSKGPKKTKKKITLK